MPMGAAPPYFFPGWDAGTVATTSLTFGTGSETLNLSLPVLTPAALDAVSLRLLAAQAQHLACRPIAEIVEVIDLAKGAGVEKVGIVTEGMRRAGG